MSVMSDSNGNNTSNNATPITDAAAITALQNFYTSFTANNNAVTSINVTSTNTATGSEADKLTATLQSVGKNNIQAVNTLLTALMGGAAMQAATQNALSTTATTTASNVKSVLPTYNTRVPYIEVYLNGAKAVPLIPQTYSSGASLTPNDYLNALQIEVLFQDIELSMPIGGTLNTITGTLKLFSRTPIELLAFITDGLNDQSTGDTTSATGLPVCEIRLGWNIADGTTTGQQLLSPIMSFIVTNIQMSDPGKSMGSEFTLSLQDAGSASLQNSSANLGVQSNYPQQQLRLLIEKCLGLRLFTLDDLLQLGSNSANGVTSPTDDSYTNETFFVNRQNAPLRINSNNFENTINELLGYISCRWYPVNNDNLSTAIDDANSANSQITLLRQSFKTDPASKKAADISQLNSDVVKLSNCCILFWVPYFPANIRTSSNTTYLQESDLTTKGAFVLLPKYTEDISIEAANLPVIYGPGGSGVPYFYGGGENVFQKLAQINSSTNAKGFSNTVGEVLDLTLNFNNFVAVMKNTYNEEVFSRIEGVPISSTNVTQLALDKRSSASRQALTNATIIKKLKGLGINTTNVTPDQALAIWSDIMTKKFELVKNRFTKALAERKIYAGDSDATMANGANRSWFNPGNVFNFSYGKLQERLGTFLQYPLTIGMTVLGDPYLLRQGIGVFEIINYYPTADGASFKFNPIVSGVYFPQTIVHRMSLGEYTTEIRALKVPNDVSNTATQSYANILTPTASANTSGPYSVLIDDVMSVNLETLSSTTSSIGYQGSNSLSSPSEVSSFTSVAVTIPSQVSVLTNTILTGNLKAQMDSAFAQFAALNAAVQKSTPTD